MAKVFQYRMAKKIIACSMAVSLIVGSVAFGGQPAGAAGRPKLNKTSMTLKVKKTGTLKVKGVKKSKLKKTSFQSKNKKIASVNKKGKVTAKKKGQTKISCRVVLKNGKKYTLSCKLTVKDAKTGSPEEEGQKPGSVPAATSTPAGTNNPTATVSPTETAAAPGASNDPGTSGSGTGNPGTTDPGTTGPGTDSPGTGDPGTTNPGTTDPGTDRPGTAKPSTTDPGTDNPGTTNPGTGDPGTTDPGTDSPSTTDDPRESDSPDSTMAEPGSSNGPAGGEETTLPAATNTPDSPSDPAGAEKPAATNIPDDPQETSAGQTSSTPTDAADQTPKPGWHFSKNGIETIDDGVMRENMTAAKIVEEMGSGTNLGNTLEACGDITWNENPGVADYEKLWGSPITTPRIIAGMKKAGFHSLRIPVAWSNMISTDGNYTIDEEYFDRVETVMNYAFDQGMYVIINIHWDHGWWGMFGSPDSSVRAEGMERYKAMWKQIAGRYQEYSDKLIFESANEELGMDGLNAELTSDYIEVEEDKKGTGTAGTLLEDEAYRVTNEINQAFVDVVRDSGGNNAKRFLLIAGYDTDIDKTCDSRFKMPADTIADHQMVSVHYYTPATYCIADKVDNSWGYQASWGTDADIAKAKENLGKMKTKFVDQGYPVIIGEYGVTDTKTPVSGENKYTFTRKEGRDVFFDTVVSYAMANGMCPMLWDANQIYDRVSCKIINEAEAAIFLQAAGEEADDTPKTEKTYQWKGTIGTSGDNVKAPVPEDGNTFTMEQKTGCYEITGVNWSDFEYPILEMEISTSGSSGYKIDSKISGVPGWQYVDDSAKIVKYNVVSGKYIEELSALTLTGSQPLYYQITGKDINAIVTFTIKEG